VLSQEENELLTRTGPGTLAGRYLRLFWQPVYRSVDLAPGQAVPIAILGERFTLYRGEEGAPHLVAFRCAHRGTQLSTGWVEGDCIRCLYHGWKYEASGQCVEQPGEDESFAAKIKIAGYPVREYLGLVFAYLGEGGPPELRRYPDFERPGVIHAGAPEVWPCNYFNRMDNDGDPQHTAFTHWESSVRANGAARAPIVSCSAEETDYGLRTESAQGDGRVTTVFVHMPNTLQVRPRGRLEGEMGDAKKLAEGQFAVDRLTWRVPIDDDNCVAFGIELAHLSGEAAEAYRARAARQEQLTSPAPSDLGEDVLAGRLRIRDADPRLNTFKLFWVEDYAAQVGQGVAADRSGEHLGQLDVSVILRRKIWLRELKALAEGRPLKGWSQAQGLADGSVVEPSTMAVAEPGKASAHTLPEGDRA